MKNSRRGRNIAEEFQAYFGSESNLANWQRLCDDVGVKGDLNSIRKCKMALKGTWVNIYDLITAVKSGKKPKRFPNQRALAAYTMETGQIFPKKKAKEGGPVRALLAHIFH